MSVLTVLLWCALISMIADGLAVIGIVMAQGARDRVRRVEAHLAEDDDSIESAAAEQAVNGHELPGLARWAPRGDIGPPT